LLHPFTFRPDHNSLAADFRLGDSSSAECLHARGDQPADWRPVTSSGVDGLFADDADTAVAYARRHSVAHPRADKRTQRGM
jgi:glycerophosphoryl diester phosphodiesterase